MTAVPSGVSTIQPMGQALTPLRGKALPMSHQKRYLLVHGSCEAGTVRLDFGVRGRMEGQHGARVVEMEAWRLRRFSDLALLNRPIGQGQLVQGQLAARHRDKHISQAKLDLLAGVDDLVAKPTSGACPLCERLPLLNRQVEEEGSEVHCTSLPAGNLKSTPIGKLPSDTLRCSMDIHERRRQNLLKLLGGMKASALAKAAKMSPSYISRCKSEPTEEGHKNIGEDIARRIEAAARQPAGWLDRDHSKPGPEESGPSAQQLADFEDARLVLLDHEWADIRARAAQVRSRLGGAQLIRFTPPQAGGEGGLLNKGAAKRRGRK